MSYKISDYIVGFDKELKLFKTLYLKGSFPNAILFQGLEGIGKYTFIIHLINYIMNNKFNNDLENNLINNKDVLILKMLEGNSEYKLDEIKEIINFCKFKSIDDNPRFIVVKNSNLLNNSSVNAILKLIEETNENLYFLFSSNFMFESSKTLESRFFKKKMFLKKKYYEKIVFDFFKNNNIEPTSFKENINDTPGIYIRKYLFSLNGDLEKLKKNNVDLFYKIVGEKIIQQYKNDHLSILKEMKINLILNSDINKILGKL